MDRNAMLSAILIGLALAVSTVSGVLLLRAQKRDRELRQRVRRRRQVADRKWWSMLWEFRFSPPKHKALTHQSQPDSDR